MITRLTNPGSEYFFCLLKIVPPTPIQTVHLPHTLEVLLLGQAAWFHRNCLVSWWCGLLISSVNVCIPRNLAVVWKWNLTCVIVMEVWDINIQYYISGSCTYAQLSCLVVMKYWFHLHCADKVSLVQEYFSKL